MCNVAISGTLRKVIQYFTVNWRRGGLQLLELSWFGCGQHLYVASYVIHTTSPGGHKRWTLFGGVNCDIRDRLPSCVGIGNPELLKLTTLHLIVDRPALLTTSCTVLTLSAQMLVLFYYKQPCLHDAGLEVDC